MNVLEQVAASLRIRLISAGEPVERGAVGIGRLLVKIVLTHLFT